MQGEHWPHRHCPGTPAAVGEALGHGEPWGSCSHSRGHAPLLTLRLDPGPAGAGDHLSQTLGLGGGTTPGRGRAAGGTRSQGAGPSSLHRVWREEKHD